MALIDEIQLWDKKSKLAIRQVYLEHGKSKNFLTDLVGCAKVPETQCGATWLIKHHLEQGGQHPTPEDLHRIILAAPGMPEWTSRLHVLQLIHFLNIPASAADNARIFFLLGVQDENKFIRAWSYSAMGHLAEQHDEYREEAVLLIHDALDKELAGSIRSRLNKALKRLSNF
ncbi:MAG: hypothetical protein AAF478_08350 [Pseudomonadota bacterium]